MAKYMNKKGSGESGAQCKDPSLMDVFMSNGELFIVFMPDQKLKSNTSHTLEQ